MYFINQERASEARTNRYRQSNFMQFIKGMYDSVDSAWYRELRQLSAVGTKTVIDQEGHPELLAFDIYGDVNAWTLLMIYNDLISEDQIVVGTVIKYPSLNDVEDVYFRLLNLSSRNTQS